MIPQRTSPPAPGRLLLIRHAQTQCTVEGRFCGAHDATLTATGETMARHLAGHPALDGIDLVLSSPATRARATAERLTRGTGKYEVDDRLRELSFGAWESKKPSDLHGDERYESWKRNPALHCPPGGESGLEVAARVVAAVRDALERSREVAVVTHKAPVRLAACFLLGIPLSRYRDLAAAPVGSVTELTFDQDHVRLRGLGDVSHLPPEWRRNPDGSGPGPAPSGSSSPREHPAPEHVR
ncbi:histidine phosphatase family protein [Saccharopolyspora elongata]|nr:histidine phosphatase family protein [Saccharopolyspora elongata]